MASNAIRMVLIIGINYGSHWPDAVMRYENTWKLPQNQTAVTSPNMKKYFLPIYFSHFIWLHYNQIFYALIFQNFYHKFQSKTKFFDWFCFHSSIWNGRKTRAKRLRYFSGVYTVYCGGKASHKITVTHRKSVVARVYCRKIVHVHTQPTLRMNLLNESQVKKRNVRFVLFCLLYHLIGGVIDTESVFLLEVFSFQRMVFDYRSVQYFWQTTHITKHL